MGQDEEERPGTSGDLLAYLMSQHGSALARIEQKLTAIEGRLANWEQLLKLTLGIALPLLVLLLTGDWQAAKRLLVP